MVEDFSPPASNQVFQIREMQYLLRSSDRYTFMDKDTYAQYEVSASQIGNQVKFLMEGLHGIKVTFWKKTLIGIELPDKVV